MASNTVPLIVVGNIDGNLRAAIKKISKARDAMATPENEPTIFVCGDLLGDIPIGCTDFITGLSKVPTHLYTLGPTTEKQAKLLNICDSHDNLSIISNVTCLGKIGVLNLAEGLTVAFVSGTEGVKSTAWNFDKCEIDDLMKKCLAFKKIDILLTYQWPFGVETSMPGSNIVPKKPSKLISHLVANIKPRMHFSANEQITFMSPPMAHSPGVSKVTTFTGLTSFDQYKTGKWVYGIQFPIKETSFQIFQTVKLPFCSIDESPEINTFFFENRSTKRKSSSTSGEKSVKKQNFNLTVDPTECWFCLSNPNVDKSLIVAIAEHVYMTLAKGPIVNNHMILVPIKHIRKLSTTPSGVEIEMHRFMQSLKDYYVSQGKHMIWFERCYKSPHLQINVIPVDAELVTKGIIDMCLNDYSSMKHLAVKKVNLKNIINLGRSCLSENYFYLQIGNDIGYMIDIDDDKKFSVNFGRTIISQALGVPERAYWKNCIADDVSVKREVNLFKEGYKSFNFTLVD